MALIVFLRGVNVGGHRTFRPSLLARKLKHYDAVSVGAAGTFVIRRPVKQAELRAEILRRLPFEAEVMICTDRDLMALASSAPFANEPPGSDVVRFVSVLAKRPRVLPSLPLSLPKDGVWLLRILAAKNKFVLGMYRRHMKAIRYLGMIDALLGVPATTRNWNTLTAIIQLLNTPTRKGNPSASGRNW
jgi:uncharacterized protein (DUF1697 family)